MHNIGILWSINYFNGLLMLVGIANLIKLKEKRTMADAKVHILHFDKMKILVDG
jgi:hypothetical protein